MKTQAIGYRLSAIGLNAIGYSLFSIGYSLFQLSNDLVAQEYPKTPPPPGPLVAAPFPPFRETVLPNGLRLLVVESRKQPIVSLSLNFPAGSISDPAGKEGLADMVAGLLTKGAGNRTAEEVAEAIEGAGGVLTASAGADFLSINSTVLTGSLPLAFELLADAVMRPRFAETELTLLRLQTLSGLQVALTQPEEIANRAFRRALYGDHPYARSTTQASARAITRDDLVALHRDRLRPAGALLVIAGAISPEEAQRLAARAFEGWTGPAPAAISSAAPRSPGKTELILVHRPGSVQSNIVVGNLTYLPNDPRLYAAAVANQVLGGGASSRLFLILREEKSWTYGAYSRYSRRKGVGYFAANSEVRTEVTDSALREMLHQMRRIRSEPVPAAELAAAKGALVGRYPLIIETADQVAGVVAEARLYGLPPDFVQTYRVRLGRVSAAEAQATAQSTIHPDSLTIVLVGDGTKMYERIKDIAPVTLLDPEGNRLTPEDLQPKAAALDLDLGALVARRDSFTIMVQGNPFGWQTSVLEPTPEGYRYTETVRLGPVVDQTTTLELDKAGGMRSVKQTGKVQGQDVTIDVQYRDGRAVGTARTPDPRTREIQSVTIDTALVTGTIDDNAIQALVPALRWAPGARWTMNVLSAGQGQIKVWTLSVSGTEILTIGGQAVEVYRTDLAGGAAPLTLWVTTQAPYRLIKIGVAGQPVEFVRVGR
ncbi:MAG TPA: pitrilysin family protein [Gemmatimonadales bacterium]|nr:pitrilysin family protein [Gemmatimonadales bacterium]